MNAKAKDPDQASKDAAEKDAKAEEKAAKEREQAEEDFAAAAAVLLEMGYNRSELSQIAENQHDKMHGENVAAAQAAEPPETPYPLLAG